MKEKKLHMIGNAHIDPVWLWRWQEGFQEIKATFRSALDRMKEYDDFIFTGSSAAFYEWVEQNDPPMFAEITQRVQEGRWAIVGGWWIQPDCNIPSGESFVRQGLYGQHFFHSRFGVTAKTGYNPDSFGHAGMLPQILKKSGMPYYTFMRPGPHEKGLPGRLFWWESDDGSRVLTFRIPFEYLTWSGDIEKHVQKCEGEAKPPFDEIMAFYGVGNHGGGPTKANLFSIRRMNELEEFPTLIISSPDQYFESVLQRDLPIPVVHDDLQHHASGTYAVHSGIKQWNRQGENLLQAAEKIASIAAWTTGMAWPDLSQAWKNLLFNQFHDILAGTSLESAMEDAHHLHGEVMAIGGRALNQAVQSLSWQINIEQEEGMKPVVVFNPHSWQAKLLVEMETGGLNENFILVDDEGNRVPYQFVRSEATVTGWRKRISFIADMPSLGWRLYRFRKQAELPMELPAIQATDTVLENRRFRLEIDPETGYIKSLVDKRRDYHLIKGGAARPAVIHDPTDTWSHGVLIFDDEVGSFTAKSVKRVEHGPIKSVIRVVSEYGKSRLIQDFTMYRELEQIDVKVTVDWHEHHKMLKLRFPTNLHFPKATYEIPYGHIERPVNGEEEPGQNWIDLTGVVRGTDNIYGLSVLNDAKYSFSFTEKEISLTVLRSPIYAHHDPYVPSPDKEYSYMDQGIQQFTYSLLPHDGGWEQGGTVKRAAELNQKAVALLESYHEGPLAQRDSFLQVDAENVIVSVVKQAEDGSDLIIRAYEINKMGTKATIRLPKLNRVIESSFGPCEIKTFRIPRDEASPVVETNLLESAE